ncbi:hypothetical protein LJC01_03500 [Clostridiaceae bacterium OttesenSCG-928-D20]|nr:hypothetical protein [Clostridiaceae bacterium OttesenSCG-928-D20]
MVENIFAAISGASLVISGIIKIVRSRAYKRRCTESADAEVFWTGELFGYKSGKGGKTAVHKYTPIYRFSAYGKIVMTHGNKKSRSGSDERINRTEIWFNPNNPSEAIAKGDTTPYSGGAGMVSLGAVTMIVALVPVLFGS